MPHNKCQLTTEEIKKEILLTLSDNDQDVLFRLRLFLGYKNIDDFIQKYFLDRPLKESCSFPNSIFNSNFISRLEGNLLLRSLIFIQKRN